MRKLLLSILWKKNLLRIKVHRISFRTRSYEAHIFKDTRRPGGQGLGERKTGHYCDLERSPHPPESPHLQRGRKLDKMIFERLPAHPCLSHILSWTWSLCSSRVLCPDRAGGSTGPLSRRGEGVPLGRQPSLEDLSSSSFY